MNDRTLVLYASKDGSTREIAEAIADELRTAGVDVDLADAAAAPGLDPYRKVILGSAVYMGRWRPEARHFVKRQLKELAQRDVWLFSSGPVGDAKVDDDGFCAIPPFAKKYTAKIGAREHVLFGGRVRTDSKSVMARGMAQKMSEEQRDRRDWDEIRAWAGKIAAGSTRLERSESLV